MEGEMRDLLKVGALLKKLSGFFLFTILSLFHVGGTKSYNNKKKIGIGCSLIKHHALYNA